MPEKESVTLETGTLSEIEELRSRLAEVEEALNAIRNGDVDAIVVSGEDGERIFSLRSSETPYRKILEEMDEGALIVNSDGTILYSNKRLADLIGHPLEKFLGSNIKGFISNSDKRKFLRLLKKSLEEKAVGVISFNRSQSNLPLYLKLSFRSLSKGMSDEICIIASDVTSFEENQIQLKKLLKKRNHDLEKANELLRKDLIEIKNTEANQQFTLARFYKILSGMNNGILLVTEDNRVEFVNNAFCNIFGFNDGPSALVNLTATEMISKIRNCYSDPEEAIKRIEDIVNLSKPVIGEEVIMHDGRTYLRDFTPIKWGEKQFGRLWNHVDITEIKLGEAALKESEERFRTIAETVPALVCITRLADSIVLFTNEFNNKAFGLSGDDIVGSKGPDYYCDPNDRVKLVEIFKRDGFINNYELKVKKNDGTAFWIITSVRPIVYFGQIAMIGASIDITETKRVEGELMLSETRLKELIATKDKFFNIVAHDLKNPFTSLIGSSELLTKSIAQMDRVKITALASIFNDAAKNGYAILENLLDWSRSQTGLMKYDPECINLRKLIDEHISNINPSLANKEIKIISDIYDNINIFADQYMIKTVIRNLLSNAVKFTCRNGSVFINAYKNDGQIIISVKDNGIGISSENIEKIFRIDSKYSIPGTENEVGTGLGLKLCKEFVEKQGGKIWVQSIENEGSEFSFSIPLYSPDQPGQ